MDTIFMSGSALVLFLAVAVAAFVWGWSVGKSKGRHEGYKSGGDQIRTQIRSELLGSGLGIERDYESFKEPGKGNTGQIFITGDGNSAGWNSIRYGNPFIHINPEFYDELSDDLKNKINRINDDIERKNLAVFVMSRASYNKYLENLERARNNTINSPGVAFFSDSSIKYHNLVEQGLVEKSGTIRLTYHGRPDTYHNALRTLRVSRRVCDYAGYDGGGG